MKQFKKEYKDKYILVGGQNDNYNTGYAHMPGQTQEGRHQPGATTQQGEIATNHV